MFILAVLFDSDGQTQTSMDGHDDHRRPKDWPHLALLVPSEQETNDLPTEEEHVDEICAQPKYVALQYTTIDLETVPESSTETIEAIEYQEKWETDVVGWFKKSNYEPVGYKTLDSEPVFDCEHGIERFAAYGRLDHKIYAWNMRQELKDSPATLSR
ncbi:hypothetical protein H9Q72_013324 [Fusarium xylarioides]|uniref:Uncharacterized protein n=1 Tax=Fusarium xylarioides TaxID=221167 RepID=A0A9P7HD34_9HYPO|nr:hypothetical protein H9Q72_013324 [Fusarium xylarioides]